MRNFNNDIARSRGLEGHGLKTEHLGLSQKDGSGVHLRRSLLLAPPCLRRTRTEGIRYMCQFNLTLLDVNLSGQKNRQAGLRAVTTDVTNARRGAGVSMC